MLSKYLFMSFMHVKMYKVEIQAKKLAANYLRYSTTGQVQVVTGQKWTLLHETFSWINRHIHHFVCCQAIRQRQWTLLVVWWTVIFFVEIPALNIFCNKISSNILKTIALSGILTYQVSYSHNNVIHIYCHYQRWCRKSFGEDCIRCRKWRYNRIISYLT